MIAQPRTYAKAIVAGVLAGLSALAAALGGDPPITALEWVTIASATIGAGALVYGIPNRPPDAVRELARRSRRRSTARASVRGRLTDD